MGRLKPPTLRETQKEPVCHPLTADGFFLFQDSQETPARREWIFIRSARSLFIQRVIDCTDGLSKLGYRDPL